MLRKARGNGVRISVIVTTYNSSGRLWLCVASLEMQTRIPDEVVIADDGSSSEHVATIQELISRSPLNATHVRQENNGYRVAAVRNLGARHSSGDYLFFVDGDAVFLPEVVEEHVRASGPRLWVTGGGIWLSEDETARVSEELIRSGKLEQLWSELDEVRVDRVRRKAIRFRKHVLKARLWPSERRKRKVKLIGIQASMYRGTFESVNGYDENFTGWGWEDTDIGLRLQLAGYRGQTVGDRSRLLHLYHQTEPRPIKDDLNSTYNAGYYSRPRKGVYWCENGLTRDYAPKHA